MIAVSLIRKAVCLIICLFAAGILYEIDHRRQDNSIGTNLLMLAVFIAAGVLVRIIYP